MQDGKYELDLTLRNNITTEEHPLGYTIPHKELHHIKKENIGLIEVMGSCCTPARLKDELELLKTYILEKKDVRSNETSLKHADWTESFLPSYRRSTQKMSLIFWNRKSERSSVRSSRKMPVFTNAQMKDSLHLTDLLRLYKMDFRKPVTKKNISAELKVFILCFHGDVLFIFFFLCFVFFLFTCAGMSRSSSRETDTLHANMHHQPCLIQLKLILFIQILLINLYCQNFARNIWWLPKFFHFCNFTFDIDRTLFDHRVHTEAFLLFAGVRCASFHLSTSFPERTPQ